MNIKIEIDLSSFQTTPAMPKQLSIQEIQQIPTQMLNLSLQIKEHAEEIKKNITL